MGKKSSTGELPNWSLSQGKKQGGKIGVIPLGLMSDEPEITTWLSKNPQSPADMPALKEGMGVSC